MRAGLVRVAWQYQWSSAAQYVQQTADGVTDENPHVGAYSPADRQAYGQALMADADEKLVRQIESERAIGSKEFAATLKMERGRYRVKRGRPASAVRIR